MPYESLTSHLGFSTGLQDYTSSIAFKDTDRTSYKSDDAYSSKKADDKDNFSTFLKSLEESNDSEKNAKTSANNEASDSKKTDKSSSDVKEERSADDDTSNSSDSSKTADTSDKNDVSSETKVETPEEKVQNASTKEEHAPKANNEQNIETVSAAPLPVESIIINLDQGIQLSNLSVNENVEVKTISPEDMSEALPGLSEKLLALIDELSGLTSDTTPSEVQSTVNTGDTNIDVSMTQGSIDGQAETPQTNSLIELLSALIGQIGEENTNIDNEGAIQTVITTLQGDENTDLKTVLSSLSPEELTDLKDQVSAYLTGELSLDEQENLAGLLAQFYPTALPHTHQTTAENPDILALTGTEATNSITQTNTTTSANTADPADTPAQNIAANTQGETATSDISAENGKEPLAQQPRDERSFTASMDGVNSDDTIKAKTQNAQTQNEGSVRQEQNPTSSGAGERFLQAGNSGQTAITGEGDAALTQQNALGVNTAIQAQSNAASSINSTVTQAQSTAHPASQMVSMTMQKAIKNGEETTIKLQLDPPELGRVEVKMSIDQDNTTKIVLTIEKPETHMMLQRDAHFLERAMSDAGLDTQGNLSFDLASDGQDFNKSNSSDDHANSGSSGDSGTDVENAIITQSSTMDWHVDPNTGRMHYSILA